MNNPVLKETQDGVTIVTLNRPEHMNALSYALRQALGDIFVELRDDEATRVIILTGAGRAFTAGLDLKELGQKGMNNGTSPAGIDLARAISEVGKPVIAAINGYAITGGFELALACDILIASEHARFADTHVRMGVVPGWGLSQRLARLIGSSRAKQLSFTGNYLDAHTAERWGLVNQVLPAAELLPFCVQMAKDICSVDPSTLKAVHRLIDFGWEHSLEEGLQEERESSGTSNKNLAAEQLETNRLNVQSRGREQKRAFED